MEGISDIETHHHQSLSNKILVHREWKPKFSRLFIRKMLNTKFPFSDLPSELNWELMGVFSPNNDMQELFVRKGVCSQNQYNTTFTRISLQRIWNNLREQRWKLFGLIVVRNVKDKVVDPSTLFLLDLRNTKYLTKAEIMSFQNYFKETWILYHIANFVFVFAIVQNTDLAYIWKRIW